MNITKYILAVGAAAAICASLPTQAETIYDKDGNVIGSYRDTGVNKYFYDKDGNDIGYSRDTGGPVYFYDKDGNLIYEVH